MKTSSVIRYLGLESAGPHSKLAALVATTSALHRIDSGYLGSVGWKKDGDLNEVNQGLRAIADALGGASFFHVHVNDLALELDTTNVATLDDLKALVGGTLARAGVSMSEYKVFRDGPVLMVTRAIPFPDRQVEAARLVFLAVERLDLTAPAPTLNDILTRTAA
jgi:hypothetical protein